MSGRRQRLRGLSFVVLGACGGRGAEPAHDAAVEPPRVSVLANADASVDLAPACRPAMQPCEIAYSSKDPDSDYYVRYERDAAGHVLRELMYSHQGTTLFREVRHVLDAAGRDVEVDTVDFGKLTFVEHYTYAGSAREASIARFDTDGDGKIDEIHHHRYTRGRIWFIDEDVDERSDHFKESLRDPAGREIWSRPHERGYRPDWPNWYVRDGHGNVVLTMMPYSDGRSDLWSDTRTYDACGNLLRDDEDWHTDGTVDETEVYRYDCP